MTFHFRLVRSDIYHVLDGFDETLTHATDYDLCLRISELTDVYHLKRSLYQYRIHNDSMSVKDKFKQMESSYDAIGRALKRRGMDSEYNIVVNPRFRLEPK